MHDQPKQISLCTHLCNPTADKKEYHCQKCKLWQEDHLIEEVKYVPDAYLSNQKTKRDLEFERRVNITLKEFMHKFTTKQHSDLCADMRDKVIKIRRAEPYAKGSRQCAAIVVYFAFQDEIRMTLRQYCKQNNLNLKLLNKKLVVYTKLFRREFRQQELSSQHNNSNIKVQERGEQYTAQNMNEKQEKYQNQPFIQLYPMYPETINEKNICKNLENLHKAVESIYDDVFRGYYFRSRKQPIVKKIADRINKIDSDLLKTHHFQEHQPVNYFYLIFAVLKHLSFRICFSRYRDIVKTKTGYYLTKQRATQARSMYQGMQAERGEEGNSEIELSFSERSEKKREWEQPLEEFELVESGPMVLQEEYFQFENYHYFQRSGNSDQLS